MLKKRIISTLVIGSAVLAFSSLATADELNFSRGETSGTFHCTSKTWNPLATVKIDTKDVEVKGFCEGQPYVSAKGHIVDMPSRKLKHHYFEYKKDLGDNSSVTVIPSSGDVTCSIGKGDKSTSYGSGGYC